MQSQMTRVESFNYNFKRYMRGSLLNLLPLLVLAMMLIFAVFGDRFIVTHDPVKLNLVERLKPPSSEHFFGTDNYGRDIFSRVISGTKISFYSVLVVLSLAPAIGVLIGVIAGYQGGLVDEILMRFTDLFMAFPAIILAIAIAATLGASLNNALLALAVVYWPWYARMIRAQVLGLKGMEYITAAKAVGVPSPRIIFRHILPNLTPIIITQVSLDVGYVILATAALSFLGLGAQPPTPEWGAMINEARQFMREAWWYTTFPGLAIFLAVLSFNLIGDALRDYLDPKLRGR